MKKREKDLEAQVALKEAELLKLKDKMSDKAQESLKDDLKRAYDVLRHLKKKVGSNAFPDEYKTLMAEMRQALGIATTAKRNRRDNIVGDSLPAQ